VRKIRFCLKVKEWNSDLMAILRVELIKRRIHIQKALDSNPGQYTN
jgi:hypothetical protein